MPPPDFMSIALDFCWTGLLTGYIKSGLPVDAVDFFKFKEDVTPHATCGGRAIPLTSKKDGASGNLPLNFVRHAPNSQCKGACVDVLLATVPVVVYHFQPFVGTNSGFPIKLRRTFVTPKLVRENEAFPLVAAPCIVELTSRGTCGCASRASMCSS